MNLLIIEDEPLAAKRLQSLLDELLPESKVIASIDSVKKSVQFFRSGVSVDLVLMDIQLADGISFEIFEQCTVNAPVIFTTAYDEYALKAFKVNSVDYILKPVDKGELQSAISKFKGRITSTADSSGNVLENIREAVRMLTKKYKSRFVIRVGEHLKTVEVDAILYFFSQDKTTFCCTLDNRKLILDYTLEELEEMVDPDRFFRINRKYLVSATAFSDIVHYTNSRLKLLLKNSTDQDVVVAREKVQEFKLWLDR
jgi:DNA-binding LytR/AlgR family response regulator